MNQPALSTFGFTPEQITNLNNWKTLLNSEQAIKWHKEEAETFTSVQNLLRL